MKLEKLGPVGPEEFWSAEDLIVLSAANVLPLLRMKEFQQTHESGSVEFGFEQSFLVLRRAFPFVGNDARDTGRNSGLPSNAPRFCSLVQNLFSSSLHLVTILQPIPERQNLKTERCLQVDTPV